MKGQTWNFEKAIRPVFADPVTYLHIRAHSNVEDYTYTCTSTEGKYKPVIIQSKTIQNRVRPNPVAILDSHKVSVVFLLCLKQN